MGDTEPRVRGEEKLKNEKINEDGKALGGKKEWPGALGVSLVRNAGFPKKIARLETCQHPPNDTP